MTKKSTANSACVTVNRTDAVERGVDVKDEFLDDVFDFVFDFVVSVSNSQRRLSSGVLASPMMSQVNMNVFIW